MSLLKRYHKLSIYNRENITDKTECFCFYCLESYPGKEIDGWTDNGQTAICPRCDIDSVIYKTEELPISRSILEKIHKFYFNFPD